MTISFDSPALRNSDLSGDWLKGGERLGRSVRGSDNVSGAVLTRVIEQEIIPRLFIAHQGAASRSAKSDVARVVDINDTDGFVTLVLSSEPAEIMDQVQTLIDQGVNRQRIYLELLAPVARRLGEFWEEDRCTFVDVSIGLSRLQRVLRELSRRNGERVPRKAPKHRVYLVQAPGERNTFGLSMVEELFLHAGWDTASDHVASTASIIQTVSQERFDVIGCSLNSEAFLGPVCDLIKQLRKMSRNPDAAIIIYGRMLIDHPELAARVDGAAVASDEVTAVETAEALVGPAPRLSAAHRQT